MGNCCSDEKSEKKHFIIINNQTCNNLHKSDYRNSKLQQHKEKELTKTSLSIETNSQSVHINDYSPNSVSDCSINGDIQEHNNINNKRSDSSNSNNNREIMKKYQFVFENNLKLPKTKKRAKSKGAKK